MALPTIVELGVVLTALAVAGGLAVRLGQSVIPAYILAGIVVGPSAPVEVAGVPLAVISREGFVEAFADLGLVALLFFLGVHVSFERLVENYRRLLASGLLDFVVNVAIGVGLGVLFGFGPLGTLFVAGIVYISSSAVVTKSLVERGWIADAESEVILGVLVFEDVAIAVYLTVVSAVALHGGTLLDAALRAGTGLGFLGVVAVVGWVGSARIERLLRTPSDELFLLRVLGVATLVAGTARFTSVSVGVTAFVVGAVVGRTDTTDRIERTLVPVRDLFSAVFFFAIGLSTRVAALADLAGLLAVAVVATTAGKLLTGSLAGRLYDLGPRRSFRVGVGTVARGEFSLVLATLAAGLAAAGPARLVPEFGVGYVLATSVLGTLSMRHEDRLADLLGLEFETTGSEGEP
ncbi:MULTISPECIES: cation:proton antiporter [Halorussus]|uniref:cation:proton antiporter n=1 Tax=Halorussus TaxID=1070314 RepID=UPI00209CA2D0|nr:cation:proton antiporter [Halorussus vallis]USZ74269.1 cation:proton antiporter [Halorussus vallis]